MLELDLAQATKFLRWLGPPRVLVAILEGEPPVAATPQDRASLEVFLRRHSDRNLYFSVNRTRPMSIKPRKSDIRWWDFSHCDIDPPADLKTSLLGAWQRQTLDKLRASSWPPSTSWVSGNGVQALWRLAAPVRLSSAEHIRRAEAKNCGLIEALAGDVTTRNIDRVLRIPGTWNIPNKVKRAAGRVICRCGHANI